MRWQLLARWGTTRGSALWRVGLALGVGTQVRALVFALDAAAAGQQQGHELAREATLRGKWVAAL